MRDGYWASSAGIRHRYRWRSNRRVLASVGQEPERKGPRGARSAGAFRRAVFADAIVDGQKHWPRARLALTLDFTTSRPQPPNVEKLAKHYLDLLGSGNSTHEQPLLYRDDRQVKMLYVSCRHSWNPDVPVERGRIHLECCSRADAIATLEAAHEVEVFHGGPALHADESLRDKSDIRDQLEDARRFEESDDELLKLVAADIRFDALRAHQEHFLGSSDQWLSRLFRTRGRELITGKPPARERRAARALDPENPTWSGTAWEPTSLQDELRGFFHVPLPALPTQRGGRQEFTQNLHGACLRFLRAHPSMSPLVVPLRITILVVPPHDKDLDNLALEVVPVVEEHFRPHQEPWLLDGTHVGLPAGLRNRDNELRERRFARLRSLGEYSVWAYQVIELHRRPEHPREGWMSVILGHGENRRSMWGEAEDYLAEALK